jgi:hypothetical protein
VEPVNATPVPTAATNLRRSTSETLRATQQLLIQTLVSESIQPGLLAKLSRPQADAIQSKVKEAGIQLQRCITEGLAVKPPIEGHRESLEQIIAALSEFNAELKVSTGGEPSSKPTQSTAYTKGAAFLRERSLGLPLIANYPIHH